MYKVRDGHYKFNFNDGGYLNQSTGAYTPPETAEIKRNLNLYNFPYRWNIHNNSNTLIYRIHNTEAIYSLDENKLKYKLKFFETSPVGPNYYIDQFLDERYIVLTVYDYKSNSNVYLFDLETEEMSLINGYCFRPLLSPDRKYLVYTAPALNDLGVNSRVNEKYNMDNGFYIKNLETGETTFYPAKFSDGFCYESEQPLNWVKEKELKKLIS